MQKKKNYLFYLVIRDVEEEGLYEMETACNGADLRTIGKVILENLEELVKSESQDNRLYGMQLCFMFDELVGELLKRHPEMNEVKNVFKKN